jgi:hypothetical protein
VTPRVIGYAFDASIHCPACARAAHEAGRLTLAGRLVTDNNGLPMYLRDSEGNPVSPLFSTDEIGPYCCACGERIK